MSLDVSKLYTTLSGVLETQGFTSGVIAEITEEGAVFLDHGYRILFAGIADTAVDVENFCAPAVSLTVQLSFLFSPSQWAAAEQSALTSALTLCTALAELTPATLVAAGVAKLVLGRTSTRREEHGLVITETALTVQTYQ